MKTLWIGCSHSAGEYSANNELINHHGIPYHVYKNFNHHSEWKSISCSGEGLIRFSTILSFLNDNFLLSKFDNLILQLTSETRLVSYDSVDSYIKIFSDLRNYINSNRNSHHMLLEEFIKHTKFSSNPTTLFSLYSKEFDTSNKTKLLDNIDTFVQSLNIEMRLQLKIHCDNILRLVKENDIKLYVYSHTKDDMSQNIYSDKFKEFDILHGKHLGNILSEEALNTNYIKDNLHPMKNGVIEVSNLISNALSEKGLK